jgi:hypothetical protein
MRGIFGFTGPRDGELAHRGTELRSLALGPGDPAARWPAVLLS